MTHLSHWPTEQCGCDPHMIQLWPTFWSIVFKVMYHDMKNVDMEQCHRFLHSWQHTELVPCVDFLKMKSLDITCFKTAWDNKLLSHQWYFSAFIRPKVHSLTRCPTLFSNEHVISGLHPYNLVSRWDPLDPPKSDPSDLDYPGHPILFQPCSLLISCILASSWVTIGPCSVHMMDAVINASHVNEHNNIKTTNMITTNSNNNA